LKKLTSALLIGALALGAYWLYGKLFPNDEQVIRALLAEVAENASVPAGEGSFAKVAAVNALAACFSPDVEIRLDGTPGEISSIQGRRELQQVVQAARSHVGSAQIAFADVLLEFGAEPGNATAQTVATARIDKPEELWVQELKMTLAKIDGAWKITRVEPARALDR